MKSWAPTDVPYRHEPCYLASE